MTGRRVNLHLTPNGIGSTVEVDGERLRGVHGVTVRAQASERTIVEIALPGGDVGVEMSSADVVVSDSVAETLVKLGWTPPGAQPRPGTSLLDGAAEPSAPNTEAATPGEFAARWNEADEEQRQGWLRSMRQESERATVCRMRHGGSWVPGPDPVSIADLGAQVKVTPADLGRC